MKKMLALLIASTFVLACLGQESARTFEADPSALAIDSERWEYLISLSGEGLDMVETPRRDNPDYKAASLLSADRALKDNAARLLLLRNRLLEMGLVKEQDARNTVWPRWVFEPPSASESADTLDARLRWLSAEATKLTEIGCEVGRKQSHDVLFCSVE
jgi:hypothetical protein